MHLIFRSALLSGNTVIMILTKVLNKADGFGSDSFCVHVSFSLSWIFLWDLVQTLHTNGASAAASFTAGGSSYFVIANSGREGEREVQSLLYRLDADGSVEVVSPASLL